jgi:hypothetical protein
VKSPRTSKALSWLTQGREDKEEARLWLDNPWGGVGAARLLLRSIHSCLRIYIFSAAHPDLYKNRENLLTIHALSSHI